MDLGSLEVVDALGTMPCPEAGTEAQQDAQRMKSLLVLRHAKSDRHDSEVADHDRPLNERGRRDAGRMGQRLRDENLLPDLILTSTARRARETVELLVSASGYAGDVTAQATFYLAGPEQYLTAVSGVNDAHGRVMVVGHNPNLEQLVERLTGTVTTLATTTLVEIVLPIARWRELDGETRGELRGVWRL
jgi:phosphohistidine phosphatase